MSYVGFHDLLIHMPCDSALLEGFLARARAQRHLDLDEIDRDLDALSR